MEFYSYSCQWRIVESKCIRLVCEKLTIFPYGQDIVENVFSLAFTQKSRLTAAAGRRHVNVQGCRLIFGAHCQT